MNGTALDLSLPSRLSEKSAIQELINGLMIEQWSLSMIYERYYNACQPIKCTYSYATKMIYFIFLPHY
ncbi:unnamed protein product [Rotaria sp. Silwood2]|nr:unnamed protein product [Rotaria sp. Silwood2]